ncbi:MAG: hypothetical protein JXB00_16770 [Bacteroidales bacterium]|nr:hypothetical protein [Bacteroidales bacterium]
MNEFEKKILKFGLALVGIFILNILATYFSIFAHVHELKILAFVLNIKNADLAFKIMLHAPGIIINLLFGILLFFDCRKELTNYILISILGGLVPVLGLMFYFIEKFSLSKIKDHVK